MNVLRSDASIEAYFEKSIIVSQLRYAEALDLKAQAAYNQLKDSINVYREACEQLLKKRNPDLYSTNPGYGVNYIRSMARSGDKYILYAVLFSGAVIPLNLEEVLEAKYG